MSAMASQITSITIVYSSVYSGADQRKHQSSASRAFVRGIHRSPVNSPHNRPVTREIFPFDDVITVVICNFGTDNYSNRDYADKMTIYVFTFCHYVLCNINFSNNNNNAIMFLLRHANSWCQLDRFVLYFNHFEVNELYFRRNFLQKTDWYWTQTYNHINHMIKSISESRILDCTREGPFT